MAKKSTKETMSVGELSLSNSDYRQNAALAMQVVVAGVQTFNPETVLKARVLLDKSLKALTDAR